MKKNVIVLLVLALVVTGMSSCRKHKDSCAAYDRVEYKADK
ncbi:MAG: hypothetical protein ACOYLH_04965 [Flavobacteriales bacterium]